MREPQPPFGAVIFDMDGVLTDSEPAFHAAVNDVLARYGTHIEAADYQQFIGSATRDMWTNVIALKNLPATLDEILEAYEPPLMARLRQPRPPLPGARELVEKLRAAHVPIALCTASFSRWVDAILGAADLHGLFGAMSTADMVERSKPHPAPYLLAAKKLQCDPARCIAIEDSANGVRSALAARMYVLQLRATATAADALAGAHVITALDQFPMELLGL